MRYLSVPNSALTVVALILPDSAILSLCSLASVLLASALSAAVHPGARVSPSQNLPWGPGRLQLLLQGTGGPYKTLYRAAGDYGDMS